MLDGLILVLLPLDPAERGLDARMGKEFGGGQTFSSESATGAPQMSEGWSRRQTSTRPPGQNRHGAVFVDPQTISRDGHAPSSSKRRTPTGWPFRPNLMPSHSRSTRR